MNNFQWLVPINIDDNLLAKLCEKRNGLIEGLKDIELFNGWPDSSLTETDTSTWTSATILNILLKQNIIPKNFDEVIKYIKSGKKIIGEYTGWFMDERFGPYISTYVTSEVLSLLITLNNIEDSKEVIKTLQTIQNHGGGWGVCPGDEESKVRSTVSVLHSLLDSFEHPITNKLIDREILKKGFEWLYSSQIDQENDHGWSIFNDCPPSSVSSTVESLSLLMRVASIDKSLGFNDAALKRGLKTLLLMGVDGFWKGDTEDVAIKINGKYISRHSTGGIGTLAVITLLIKAIKLGLMPVDSFELYEAINNLISRSKAYKEQKGLWITPADQGGAPIIWNSAFALNSISEIQKYYITILENNYIEKKVFDKIAQKTYFWKKISLSLIIAIIGTFLSFILNTNGIITSFSNFSTLTQGIVLMILALFTQEFYQFLFKPFLNKIKNLTSR